MLHGCTTPETLTRHFAVICGCALCQALSDIWIHVCPVFQSSKVFSLTCKLNGPLIQIRVHFLGKWMTNSFISISDRVPNHTVLLWSVQWEVVALGSFSSSVKQFASVARQRGMFCKSRCGQIKVKFSPPVTVEKSLVFMLRPGLNRSTPLSAMGECKTFTSTWTLSSSWFHCQCGSCCVS